MAKAFDDAVKPGRAQFAQPSNGAYGVTDCDRRVEIVPDGYRVHYARRGCKPGKWVPMGRREYGTADKRLCIEDAPKWVNA